MEQIKIKNKDKKLQIETQKDISAYIDIMKKMYGKMYLAFYGRESNIKKIDPKSDESWYRYVSASKVNLLMQVLQMKTFIDISLIIVLKN